MMDEEKIDVLELQLRRIGKDKSHAGPVKNYGDPSRTVRLQSESACGKCNYRRTGTTSLFCGRGQEFGKKCEFFRLEKK